MRDFETIGGCLWCGKPCQDLGHTWCSVRCVLAWMNPEQGVLMDLAYRFDPHVSWEAGHG